MSHISSHKWSLKNDTARSTFTTQLPVQNRIRSCNNDWVFIEENHTANVRAKVSLRREQKKKKGTAISYYHDKVTLPGIRKVTWHGIRKTGTYIFFCSHFSELTWVSVTPGARNCESFSSSQMSPRVPSPLGSLAAASRTVITINHIRHGQIRTWGGSFSIWFLTLTKQ